MKIALIFSLLFLSACSNSPQIDIHLITSELSKQELLGKSLNLEHSRYFPVSSLSDKPRNTEFLERIDFIPIYVGKEQGLIKIRPEGDYHTMYYPDWYYGLETPNIEVFVDTTHTLSNVYQREFDESIGRYRSVPVLPNHEWYPVYIHSTGTDTVSIGYDLRLELFMEVLDTSGKWKPIHHPNFPGCGVGKYQIVLPPNEYAITTVPKYAGDFKTRARLKLYDHENIYSNEFGVEINTSQFTPGPGNEFALRLIDWIFYQRN